MIPILLMGFGLRLMAWWLVDNSFVDDGASYWQIAQNIIFMGKYFGSEGVFFRPPFYPVFLSSFLNNSSLAIFAQIILSLLTACLIYKILWRLSSPKKAIIAFALYCLSFEVSLFSVIMMSETLLLFLIVFGFFLQLSSKSKYIYLSSIVWGLAVLTRPIVILPLATVLIMGLTNKKGIAIASTRSRIALLVLFLLLPFFWSLKVSVKAGAPTFISTNGGLNLYIAHNPSSTGSYDQETEKVLHVFKELNEFERNKQYKDKAIEYLKTHPWQTLLTTVKKPFFLFASFGGSAEGVIIRSIGRDFDLRNLVKIAYSSLHLITYWLVLFLGIYHLLFKRMKEFRPFYLFCLVYIISLLFFFTFPRFRLPLTPFLVIFASNTIINLRKPDLKKLTKTAIIFCVLIIRDLNKIFDFLNSK